MKYAAVLALLALNLSGTLLIKVSPRVYHQFLLLGALVGSMLVIYGLRAAIWLVLGRRYQLSYIYPVLGINYVLSLFVGMAVFNEPFIWQRMFGAVVILFGVSLLSFSTHRDEKSPERGGK